MHNDPFKGFDTCPRCEHGLRLLSDNSILCSSVDDCECLCGTAIDELLEEEAARERDEKAVVEGEARYRKSVLGDEA